MSMIFTVVVCEYAFSADPVSENSSGNAMAYQLSAIMVNTIPGFGLGSLSQGDKLGFRRGLLYDALTWSLLGFGITALNMDENGPLSGAAVASLLVGYGGFMWSRGYGIVRPIVYSPPVGDSTEPSLLAPILFNNLPGFGLGSYVQGDTTGGFVGSALDFTAFILVGVLSGAALGGEILVSQGAGIGALTAFSAARVWGVVRPIRYQKGKTNLRRDTPDPPASVNTPRFEHLPRE